MRSSHCGYAPTQIVQNYDGIDEPDVEIEIGSRVTVFSVGPRTCFRDLVTCTVGVHCKTLPTVKGSLVLLFQSLGLSRLWC